jgi:two-component system, response regulator
MQRLMKTVLYIDDSADDLFLFQRACQAAEVSFSLKVADAGLNALRYLSGAGEFGDRMAHPLPDIILLDIKMPGMDGFEVLNWIRAHPQVSNTMVALYSSSTVDKDVLRGFLGGTTFYIPKPHTVTLLTELAQALDDCLKSEGQNCGRLWNLSVSPAQV